MKSTRTFSWTGIASAILLWVTALTAIVLFTMYRADLRTLEGPWELSTGEGPARVVDLPFTLESWEPTEGPVQLQSWVELEQDSVDLALLVPAPVYDVQLYWDGVHIGGTGELGGESIRSPPGEPVIAPIPHDLAGTGSHLLVLEIEGASGRLGLKGRVEMGSEVEALKAAEHHRMLELVLPLVNAGIALTALLLSLLWTQRKDLFWLGILSACAVGFGLVESSMWWIPFDVLGNRMQLSIAFRSALVASAVHLYAWFVLRKIERLDYLISAFNLMFALLALVPWTTSPTLLEIESLAGLAALTALIRALWLLIRALASRSIEYYLMMLGLGAGGVALICDLLYVWAALPTRSLVPILSVGMGIFSLVALVSRLSDESARYEQLINMAEDALMVVDIEGRIWEANPAALRLLGVWEPGDSLIARLPEENREPLRAHIQGSAQGRRLEMDFQSSGGDARMESVAVDLPGGRIVMTLRDITARRAMESGLLHTARMETVGSLAGGIAHDFNNTMTALLGQVGIMQVQTRGEQRGPLSRMESIILHAARMMQRLLAVSRGSLETHAALDLRDLAQEAIDLAKVVLPSRIEFLPTISPGSLMVMGSSSDLEQLILNLVVNSRDALGTERGQIWLEINEDAEESGMVELIIEDSGPGIPVELREEIWRPFFTTKGFSRGTGLGLSVVARIVGDHGGSIALEPPRHARGCRFRVLLPLLDESAPRATDIPLDVDVMVVEDDVDIRGLICRNLEEMGCRVVEFPDAEQALLYAQGSPLSLLVTDAVLPGADGLELARQLTQQQPALRVLVISAFLPQNAAKIDPNWHCIAKPFAPQGLKRAVRRAVLERS
jgi:PAS domain S-box-containing protein